MSDMEQGVNKQAFAVQPVNQCSAVVVLWGIWRVFCHAGLAYRTRPWQGWEPALPKNWARKKYQAISKPLWACYGLVHRAIPVLWE